MTVSGQEVKQRRRTKVLLVLILVMIIGILAAIAFLVGSAVVAILSMVVGTVVGSGGGALVAVARSEQRKAQLHTSGLPLTTIAAARQGDLVRVSGRVTSPPAVMAPLSHKESAFARLSVTQIRKKNDEEEKTELQASQWDDRLRIVDGECRALIEMNKVQLLSKHALEIPRWSWQHEGHSDADAETLRFLSLLYPGQDFQKDHWELGEARIDHDEMVFVTGKVAGVEGAEHVADGGAFRTAEKRIKITRVDGGQLRLTNLSDEEVRGMARGAKILLGLGAVALLFGCSMVAGGFIWLATG